MKTLKGRIAKLEGKLPRPKENGAQDEDITHFEAYLKAFHSGRVIKNWSATPYLRSLSKFLLENCKDDGTDEENFQIVIERVD